MPEESGARAVRRFARELTNARNEVAKVEREPVTGEDFPHLA
jgi:hypothetical protein